MPYWYQDDLGEPEASNETEILRRISTACQLIARQLENPFFSLFFHFFIPQFGPHILDLIKIGFKLVNISMKWFELGGFRC